jgi:hypothetical protein
MAARRGRGAACAGGWPAAKPRQAGKRGVCDPGQRERLHSFSAAYLDAYQHRSHGGPPFSASLQASHLAAAYVVCPVVCRVLQPAYCSSPAPATTTHSPRCRCLTTSAPQQEHQPGGAATKTCLSAGMLCSSPGGLH